MTERKVDMSNHLARPSVVILDQSLGHAYPVLDHGFVRVIDYMGDEAAIVQAARVSYGAGTKTPSNDRGLIRYLMRHYHTTPLEMCEIKLHMKLPLFVARQWIRHRTANVNEYSARYSILAREFFIPRQGDIAPQSKTNKQGRFGTIPDDVQLAMIRTMEHWAAGGYQLYEELMHGWPWFDEDGERLSPARDKAAQPHDGGHGMARELARMVLPVNVYTEWYWKCDLHNLLHLLRLRADPHAQKEIREYARLIAKIVQVWLPNVWEAFVDYELEALRLSRMEAEIVRTLVARNPGAARHLIEEAGFSDGEMREALLKLGATDAG